MPNETIADIVREMREYRIDECDRNWCDRIEAAAKRENDRLRAALKPVLDIKISEYDTDYGTGRITSGNTFDAVREAQRIYKEGEAK